MKKLLLSLCTLGMMTACQTAQQPQRIGGDTDAHGCLTGTGATWSYLKQQCVQTFNIADIRLEEVVNGTSYGIYVILSEDKQQAEVFSVSLPKKTILKAVKGGFISDDNKIRLIKHTDGWKLIKNQ